MKERTNILMIGGTGRNVGKTEFVCQCIKHFVHDYNIIALKVTNHFHFGQERTYSITLEESMDSDKDTSRMLRAGAEKVYFIQTEKEFLETAFSEFEKLAGKDSLIICESNGLRDIVRPGVFLVVKNANKPEIKPSAVEKIQISDAVVISDDKSFNLSPASISVIENSWTLL